MTKWIAGRWAKGSQAFAHLYTSHRGKGPDLDPSPNVHNLHPTLWSMPAFPPSSPSSPTSNSSLSLLVINHLYITLFSHVGRFHDPRICQLYFRRVPRTKWEYSFPGHASELDLEVWVEFYSPSTMCEDHYSSRYYSLE